MRPEVLAALILAAVAVPAAAQSVVAAKAGLISYVEGQVLLDGKAVELSPSRWPEAAVNAILQTRDGRAEVMLNPCVVLHLGENSSLRMIANRLEDTRLEMLSGAAVVQADGSIQHSSVRLVAKNAVAPLAKKGVYRFDMEPPRLKVMAGSLVLERADRPVMVKAGFEVGLDGEQAPEKFDRRQAGALDEWSRRRAAVLAKTSGTAGLEARQEQETDAAAKRAASVEAPQTDPENIRYDGRHLPPPPLFPVGGPGGNGSDRAHVCVP